MARDQQLMESPATYLEEPAPRPGEGAADALLPGPISRSRRPPTLPSLAAVSGLYAWRQPLAARQPPTRPVAYEGAQGAVAWRGRREELRLDLDGEDPQMVVSGTIFAGLTERVHWIASVAPAGPGRWDGAIWSKDGTGATLPHSHIQITAQPGLRPDRRQVTVRYSGGGAPELVRTYGFASPFFRPVELEFDHVEGTSAITAIDSCAHPNRPASLPCETLTIADVFRRAGFDATVSDAGAEIPISEAGADRVWSDQEMHDAMQVYWSRFAHAPQWAMWVLFASLHEDGPSLGGVMFDDIGPNHRQGTAIFNDSFIADPPPGDPAPAAWVQRMRFWTACHEMGHAFNLAHSWQKSHPPHWGTPWIPLDNEPEVRSFMNYPFRVQGGQTAFFADFAYRFSDQELLFMRHAPARFVQMGNADWFDHHGFEQAEVSPEPRLRLEVRVNRDQPAFEFLEPVMVELKITNVSGEPQLIDEDLLAETDHMTVILKKEGRAARQWLPYAQYCHKEHTRVLEPGQSCYEALFLGAGRNGWDLAEPGIYTVQLALRLEGEDLVSNRLRLKVAPPHGYDEEALAQDVFSDEVGRVLAFDGSLVLDAANEVLREAAAKLAKRRIAHHALVALARPLTRLAKVLTMPEREGAPPIAAAADAGARIRARRPKPDEARKQLDAALMKDDDVAAETLGHIEYREYVDQFSDWLAANGDPSGAAKRQNGLLKTLKARKVADWVLKAIERKRESYKG